MTQLEEIKQLKAQIKRLKTERLEMFERLASWHESLAGQYRSIVDVHNGNTISRDEALDLLKQSK